MREKLSFYFVLYLVALTALLAVTNERNIAMREGKELVYNLIGKLNEQPVITVSDSAIWIMKQEGNVPILIAGVDHAQSSVRYNVEPLDHVAGTVDKEFFGDENGNGQFSGRIENAGRYKFRVIAEVTKRLPDSLSQKLRERIIRVLGDSSLHLKADTTFYVTVTPRGPEPTQFTLSVERPVHDKGFIGIPYSKTIFVNGADSRTVVFSGYDNRMFSLTRGTGRVQLTWQNPARTSSPITITLRGNTRQGFGHKDIAEASFTLEVLPPRWNPEPSAKAFWGVPYQLSSGIAGINPDLYSIQVFVNANLIRTITPHNFPDTIRPSSHWTTIVLKAISDGKELASKTIEVRKPDPPQQPKWVNQTLEGKDYVIQFTCSDVNGDAVTVNLKVAQPDGFQSRISSTAGKSFTLRILDVAERRPPAIEIRGSIQGIGGTREVRKTFSLFY
jgi:hypothetical protein